MGWRSIILSNPARLSIEHNALVIEKEETVSIPLEDIAFVVLDHPQISFQMASLDSRGQTIIWSMVEVCSPQRCEVPQSQLAYVVLPAVVQGQSLGFGG